MKKSLPTVKTVENRKFSKLKPYPRQEEFFPDLPDAELQALADDIAVRGLQEKIEILPDGTVISGHQRLRALKLLKYKEYDVVVRYDLANADENTIDREFLAANLHRRHLDKLSMAKAALGIYESKKGYRIRNDSSNAPDARDHVGEIIGMSGRNLNRYWNTLQAPTNVQEAFRTGQISLVQAEQVGLMSLVMQNLIAKEIENGEDAKTVVSRHIASRIRRNVKKTPVFSKGPRFFGALKKARKEIDNVIAKSVWFPRFSPQLAAQIASLFAIPPDLQEKINAVTGITKQPTGGESPSSA